MHLRLLSIATLFFVTTHAQARDVSISLAAGQTELILTNPSSTTVNYNITCHKPDASGTIVNLTSQTLAPNARATHSVSLADTGLCAASANPAWSGTDTSGKSFYACNGSTTYANANNNCGVGNAFCYPDLNYTVYQCGGTQFWVKNDGGVVYQPMCGSFAAVTGGNQVAVGNVSYSGLTKKTMGASACSGFAMANEIAATSSAGAICCSQPLVASVCKITINTTGSNAYLASPSFQGGAAF